MCEVLYGSAKFVFIHFHGDGGDTQLAIELQPNHHHHHDQMTTRVVLRSNQYHHTSEHVDAAVIALEEFIMGNPVFPAGLAELPITTTIGYSAITEAIS